jgi:hypothetical protein
MRTNLNRKGRVSLPITLAAFFSIALAFTFNACGGDDSPTGDGGVEGGNQATYSGTSGGKEYVLKITESIGNAAYLSKNISSAVYSPKVGDSYILTVGGKTSTGTVSSFDSGTFTLKPSNSETPFTATILGSDLVAMGGTITWSDNTISEAPSTLTPSTSGSSSSSSDGGASCGKLMSQNLNTSATGSVCYDNIPANCDKYGKLYDWATAMALPAKCNTTLSTSDPECAIQNKHRGICPSGQHIPSKEELEEYGSYGCLKNQAGGYGYSGGYFDSVGSSGSWWSASGYGSNDAYYWYMGYNGGVFSRSYDKSSLFSVRCVQD